MKNFNVNNDVFKQIFSSSKVIFLLLSILLITVLKRTHKIQTSFNEFENRTSVEMYTNLDSNIDSLAKKINELKQSQLIVKKHTQFAKSKGYWNGLNIKNYSYNLKGGACSNGYEYDVIVKDGEIETITSNDKTKITSKDFFNKYGFVPTINELYKIFEEIIIFINPDDFSINYDNKFKYPKSAFFDYRSCVLDEESCWQVDDLNIINYLMPKKMYNDGVIATFIRC